MSKAASTAIQRTSTRSVDLVVEGLVTRRRSSRGILRSASYNFHVAHTLIAVPVPEADALVRRLAAEWEPSYDLGTAEDVHAHITVLSPFVPLDHVDDDLHGRLQHLFSGVEPFAYELADVRVFPNSVVYLAPEPAESFRGLTAAAATTFPGYLPYEAKYEQVTPHMTVGPIRSPEMERTLVGVASELVPVNAVAREVRLIFNDHNSFRTVARYAFEG